MVAMTRNLQGKPSRKRKKTKNWNMLKKFLKYRPEE